MNVFPLEKGKKLFQAADTFHEDQTMFHMASVIEWSNKEKLHRPGFCLCEWNHFNNNLKKNSAEVLCASLEMCFKLKKEQREIFY